MSFFVIFLIAVSLSMDAFSLALSFGTLVSNRKTRIIVSSTVGVFHFFMPLLGSFVGTLFMKNLNVQADFLEGIIFLYIALVMFKDFKSDSEETFNIGLIGILLFALGVSLDSFGVGFALNEVILKMIKCSMTFAITSFLFTFTGMNLGNKLNSLVGKYSILIGASIMFILSLINFCQFLL